FSLLLSSTFSFLLPADHLDLHSFPTRRSSDLGGTERVCLEGSRRTPSEYCGRHRHRAFLPHEGRSAGRERVQGADERMTLECERTCGQTSPFSPAVGTESRLSTGRTR